MPGGLSSTTPTYYCQLGVGGGGREKVAALRVASAGASGFGRTPPAWTAVANARTSWELSCNSGVVSLSTWLMTVDCGPLPYTSRYCFLRIVSF